MDPITEPSSVQLDRLEEFAARSLSDSGHILHHKHRRLEKLHVVEVVPIKKPSRILDKTLAVIRAVYFSNPAESLARRTSNDDVDLLLSNKVGQVLGFERRQVATENMLHIR
jgi:hypothetical protein